MNAQYIKKLSSLLVKAAGVQTQKLYSIDSSDTYLDLYWIMSVCGSVEFYDFIDEGNELIAMMKADKDRIVRTRLVQDIQLCEKYFVYPQNKIMSLWGTSRAPDDEVFDRISLAKYLESIGFEESKG